jgi:subtilisin
LYKKILVGLLSVSLVAPSFALAEKKAEDVKVVPNEYLISFEPHEKDTKAKHYTKHIEGYVKAFGGEVIKMGEEIHYALVKLPNEKVADALENKKEIKDVEPNTLVETAGTTSPIGWTNTNANSPQWNGWGNDLIDNANYLGLKGDGVKVLVIDTGATANHPDISFEKITGSQGSTATTTHGMGASGVIAAKDNTIGTKGVAPNVRLFSWQAQMSGSQYLNNGYILDGIDWAIANGMDFINASYSSSAIDAIMSDAYQEAYQKGVLTVAAAGNDTGDGLPNYPADLPNVLNITALQSSGQLASYSERGLIGDEIDFTAPTDNPSTSNPELDYFTSPSVDGVYYFSAFNGTSSATPHTTGALSLYRQAYPHVSLYDLVNLAKSQAVNIGLGSGEQGSGRINAPQSDSGKRIEDFTHGAALYQSISGTTYTYGNGIPTYSRVMDDPAQAAATTNNPARPYEKPFEGATIRHTVTKVGGGDTFTTAITAGTNGRYDYTIPVTTAVFPTVGQYDVFTRTSYKDPVTGQSLYKFAVKRVTIQ